VILLPSQIDRRRYTVMLIICLSCAWVFGIFLGYFFSLPWVLCLFGLAPLLLLLLNRRYYKWLVLAGLGIVLVVISTNYSFSSLYTIDDARLRFYNDQGTFEVKGTVARDPDVRDKSAQLTLSVDAVRVDTVWRDVEGTALVFVPRFPSYRYGDVLQVTGELQTPPRLDDFDYRGYLEHQGIYTVVYYPGIEALDTGQGFPPLAWIYSLRQSLAQTLAQVLPEPQSSLAQGIILGMRGNIPADLNDAFARSGTTHLLAISGYNIGIMAGIMLGVGLFLFGRRRYLYVWLALAAVWFYAVITGMSPPVLRGAIMATVFLAAEALGRQRSGMVALTLAAAIMVGVHPYILGDASFQLSFLAMAGLVFIYPVFNDLGRRFVASRIGAEGLQVSLANLSVGIFAATLGAIIAVWPVVAYYFGIFSLVGPLATFLATLVLPFIIIFGSLAALLGLASLAVAQAFGWLAWPFLSYMIAVVSGLGTPAVAAVDVGFISPVFIVCYYVALAAAVWLHARWQRVRGLLSGASGLMKSGAGLSLGLSGAVKWAVAPLSLLAVLVSFTAFTLPDDDLHVSFLDVGQGDAIFIQKGSHQVLVDGGPSPGEITLALGEQMSFWDRSIDLLVLTHPHQDHLAGLLEVLRRYHVGQVLYSSSDYSSPLFDEWLRTIEAEEVESTVALSGHHIDLGDGVTIEVVRFAPLPGVVSDVDNESLVLRLEYGEVSFLLAADIGSEAEWELLRERAPLASTVLKVAHHGSDTSSTLEFLSVVDPRAAVISVGADNDYGLPDEEVLDRLGERTGRGNIYRTDEQGTITFTTDGEKLWVEIED
jgi:competence protein ComEC